MIGTRRSLSVALLTLLLSSLLWTSPAHSQDERFRIRVLVPQGEVPTGTEFDSAVLLDTDVDGLQGWSFAIEHDPAVVELLSANPGQDHVDIDPQFEVFSSEPDGGAGIVSAVVFSFVEPITLPAGTDYELATARYRLIGDPTAVDPCEPIQTTLAYSSVLANMGGPPFDTVLTVAGETIAPQRIEGNITIRCPGTLEITRCEGDTENIYLEWSFGGEPDWAFLALYRDGEFLALLDPDATNYDDLGLEPGDYTYSVATIIVDDPTNPTLIFAHCTGTVIPVTVDSVTPQLGYFVGGTEITVTGTAFSTVENTTITLTGGEGEEPLIVEVLEIVSDTELRAVVPASPRLGFWGLHFENERGAADFADAFEYGFIRGEVNGDVIVDLSDAVLIFDFLFLGADEPACLDAVDSTDDGLLDLSDGIRILGHLFLGDIPPEAPYPDVGQDTNDDDGFGCLN